MRYSKQEVMQYVQEEDVKFIRLSFCDVFGRQKNISIMPDELPRAFAYGIAFDGSAIAGFGDETHSDLLLHPEPETLSLLPWRPEHGKVVRMFSTITYPDGRPFECDTRTLLKRAVSEAAEAGYMDLAPDDSGENIRREICLTLEQMGIRPESSHHEEGPGQNEIDFRYSDALTAADNALTFQTVVKTVARRNGLCADFSAKPLDDAPGNGFHINMSVKAEDASDNLPHMVAGILENIVGMTAFLNPTENSYKRFGSHKAPRYVSWSSGNRSQLIRIPAAEGEYCRAELRSPDPTANPYLAFALLIYAGLYGIQNKPKLPEGADFNLFKADAAATANLARLPETLRSACQAAADSAFIRAHLPQAIRDIYCNR